MARTMTSQCIHHLAVSQSHTVKQRRNEQHRTCPNCICSELAHTAKPVLGKGKMDAVKTFPRKQDFCVFPLSLGVCPNILS